MLEFAAVMSLILFFSVPDHPFIALIVSFVMFVDSILFFCKCLLKIGEKENSVYKNGLENTEFLHQSTFSPFERERKSEKANLLHQDSSWVCGSCYAEFRISHGKIPIICPSCGETLVAMPEGTDSETAVPYNCAKCGPYFMLYYNESNTCPICGGDEIKKVNWALKRSEHWECSGCSQEFVSLRTPKQCPHCGEIFSDGGGEMEDEDFFRGFRCSSCGERTELLDWANMLYCPCCGKKIEDSEIDCSFFDKIAAGISYIEEQEKVVKKEQWGSWHVGGDK